MAKRKSINKRTSRYSHRSSVGSGFLDPNSEILEEGKYCLLFFVYTFNKICNALLLFTTV